MKKKGETNILNEFTKEISKKKIIMITSSLNFNSFHSFALAKDRDEIIDKINKLKINIFLCLIIISS